jgi:hypothetical protein
MKGLLSSIIALALLLGAQGASAGDMIEVTAVHSGYFQSDGEFHENGWTNTTGATIYIKRVWALLFPPSYSQSPGVAVGAMSGYVYRESDQNIATYWNWNVTSIPPGPNGTYVETDFAPPTYFALANGDRLTLATAASGFNGQNAAIALWFWYTTQP